MAEEQNGHGISTRLDRIERALEALIEGHERLVESQRQLLTAQVVMTDTVTTLGKRVDELTQKVDSHEDNIQMLIDSQLRVNAMLAYFKNLVERRPTDPGTN
jgi:hypothetical protein